MGGPFVLDCAVSTGDARTGLWRQVELCVVHGGTGHETNRKSQTLQIKDRPAQRGWRCGLQRSPVHRHCGPVANCWPAPWLGSCRSASSAASSPPQDVSYARLRAPISAKNGQANWRRRPPSFARGPWSSKHWRGTQHVVMVLADGFQHQGKVYASPLPAGPGNHRHTLERSGLLRPAQAAWTRGGGAQ
jgi:hypothetical protein